MGSPPSKESESNRGGRIGRRIMGFRKTSTSRRNAREGAREEDEGEEEGGTRTSAQRRDHLVIRELDSFFCPTLYEKEEERFLDERRRMKRSDSKKRKKKKKKKKKKKEKKEGDDKGKEKLRGSAALRGMSSNSHQEAIGRTDALGAWEFWLRSFQDTPLPFERKGTRNEKFNGRFHGNYEEEEKRHRAKHSNIFDDSLYLRLSSSVASSSVTSLIHKQALGAITRLLPRGVYVLLIMSDMSRVRKGIASAPLRATPSCLPKSL
uniref:Uncharacterized protein n=1 Tax=Vespula pensylvanica TaxID=30213 RepID=A0A834U9W2_VESPE|nr:hypothetical protein H0235_007533 [Vespula pensylvanica]